MVQIAMIHRLKPGWLSFSYTFLVVGHGLDGRAARVFRTAKHIDYKEVLLRQGGRPEESI